MRILVLLNLTFALAGCAAKPSPTVQSNPAVKMRYWATQAANRERIPLFLPVQVPERTEDGVRRVPSTEILVLPR